MSPAVAVTRDEHEALDSRVRVIEQEEAAEAVRWTHLEASVRRIERIGWAVGAGLLLELTAHGAVDLPPIVERLLTFLAGG